MSLPNFQQLMLPLLSRAAKLPGETCLRELEEAIGLDLGLATEVRTKMLPSGQQTVFLNRLNWAKSYMSKAGLLETTRRGYFAATPDARSLVAENLGEIDVAVLSRFPAFLAWKAQQKANDGQGDVARDLASEGEASPEDHILANFERLNRELSADLVQRIQDFSPAFFERLIIDLLVRMGYGGGRADMARALGRSGDGGVDGLVKEDELGLDVVYVQAKRYAPGNGVPVGAVRDFVGSLDGLRASKGIFVTTSHFPVAAVDFVGKISKRVILVDGQELARLMIRHKVGVRIRDAYEIKKIDEDYFVE